MILLTAAKVPEGLDKNILASAVFLMFSNPENEKYIREIKDRQDTSAACESLFALALVYGQIRDLPCRIDTSRLVFRRNGCNKPYFADSPVKFNISHSKGYVACAVSLGEELGVDIEAAEISPERAEKLAKRYFSEQERHEISKSPQMFARKWTEKEAKAKFLGESVGNILSSDKIDQKSEDSQGICLHSFSFDKIPITLCTKRDFSTISFTIQ